MDKLIFGLCAAAALLCAVLLLRGYARNGSRLLLWSGACFVLLSISNAIIIADRWVFTTIDLSTPRLVAALAGMVLLIYGLIWENE